MKKLVLLAALFAIGCTSQQKSTNTSQKNIIQTSKISGNDDFKVYVEDPGYEIFLRSKATPITQYTESHLKQMNASLVEEWNLRFNTNRNPKVYETSIVYDIKENHGLDFEYRLYQFFAYTSYKYGVKFPEVHSLNY